VLYLKAQPDSLTLIILCINFVNLHEMIVLYILVHQRVGVYVQFSDNSIFVKYYIVLFIIFFLNDCFSNFFKIPKHLISNSEHILRFYY
jgi:hypothetical protein